MMNLLSTKNHCFWTEDDNTVFLKRKIIYQWIVTQYLNVENNFGKPTLIKVHKINTQGNSTTPTSDSSDSLSQCVTR